MSNDEAKTELVLASRIGLTGWPEEFEHKGVTWMKDHVTAAANGEIQCVEYGAKDNGESLAQQKWLIVINE